MSKVIGVRFQENGKVYSFDPNGIEAGIGQYVIANTSRGPDLGEVVIPPSEQDPALQTENLKKLIRIATDEDVRHASDNRLKEQEAFAVCQRKIAEHKLEMKLVSVEYAFDNSKILFFFTANGRVDFRSLVKDLASVFRMRIELRQIGVRDEAKMLGGLGPCGRPICCRAFLDQFQPVSIKMAKEQNLSLNPTKISGVCGRLMCCLKYEQDHYEQTRKRMPRVGREVSTPDGVGQVSDLNIVKETVFVRLTNGDTSEIKEYPLELVSRPGEKPAPAPAAEPDEILPAEVAQETAVPEEAVKEEAVKEETAHPARRESRRRHPKQDRPAKTEKQDKQEKTEKPAEDGDNAPKDGAPRARRRNRQLGQPVRRENPNRPQSKPEQPRDPEPVQDAAQPMRQSSPKPQKAPSEPKKSSWADAVQSAMRAIDHD